MDRNLIQINDTEYKVTFSDGNDYILREYYDCDDYDDNIGIEIWDLEGRECLCAAPGASFLDLADPDATEYNAKELLYIEGFLF